MKIDAFCHVMPREYAERLEAVDDAPAAANIRNRIAGIPSMVDLDLRFRADGRVRRRLPAGGQPAGAADRGPRRRRRRGASSRGSATRGWRASCAEHPDRFAGFVAQLPMNDPEGTLEAIDHACGDLGALGVQIYTHVNGHPLDEERFEPFWARMAELGKPVWVHPSRNASWSDYPTEEVSKYEIWWVFGWEYDTAAFMARIVFSGVLERHPDLKILIHHGGSMVPHFAGRVGPGWDQLGARTPPERAHQIEHAPLSKRPLDYFKMFYADTAMFGAAHAIQCCIEFFGVDRDPVRLGHARSTPRRARATSAPRSRTSSRWTSRDEDREKIYAGNARRVLGVA